MASSTLRTSVLILVRRALLISVRRAVLRTAFLAELVFAIGFVPLRYLRRQGRHMDHMPDLDRLGSRICQTARDRAVPGGKVVVAYNAASGEGQRPTGER